MTLDVSAPSSDISLFTEKLVHVAKTCLPIIGSRFLAMHRRNDEAQEAKQIYKKVDFKWSENKQKVLFMDPPLPVNLHLKKKHITQAMSPTASGPLKVSILIEQLATESESVTPYNSSFMLGIGNGYTNYYQTIGKDNKSWCLQRNGQKLHNGNLEDYMNDDAKGGKDPTANEVKQGDVIEVSVDGLTGIRFKKNGKDYGIAYYAPNMVCAQVFVSSTVACLLRIIDEDVNK